MSTPTVRRQPRSLGMQTNDCMRGAPILVSKCFRLLLVSSLSLAFVVAISSTSLGDDANEAATPDYLNGSGIMGSITHTEGTGVPQIFPLTPVQLFPYLIYDQSLFFSDLRVFPTNYGTVGGNAGLGSRYYSESFDRVFGISGWYDGDNTRRVLFQQLGLSLESYGQAFDVRSNLYLPVGPLSRQTNVALVNGSTQFQGDNLYYSQYQSWITAMKGVDAEIGRVLPFEFAEEHGLRLFGGGYYFKDDQGDSITGGSARFQVNLLAGLDMQGQVTYDNFFKTRAFLGIRYTFGALHRSQMSQTTSYGRIGEYVNRNYTVVAEGHSSVDRLEAVNPTTGAAYTFAHVDSSAAPGGDGSVNHPFNTLAAAQAVNRNIIFVHAGSIFNNALVIKSGEQIMGDGGSLQNFIQVPQLGALLLPQGAGPIPVLNVSAGDAVTLASNSQFSGFTINATGGNGIVGNNVQNVLVSNVTVNNASQNGFLGTALQNVVVNNLSINSPIGDGIQLASTAGPVSFTNTSILNPGGSGINIQSGTGAIQFLGQTSVSGAIGPSVLINNLQSAGSVGFGNLSIDHRGGVGVEIQNSAGTVNASGTTTISNELNATAAALDISNSSLAANFNAVQVNNATTTGSTGAVNLQTDTGTTNFTMLNINSAGGTALAAHSAGNLNINPSVNNSVNTSLGGTIVASNGTAVDIQNTNINIDLISVSSNHTVLGGTGINLINTTGTFGVFGNGSAGSGGTITNASTGVFLQSTGPVALEFMNINANTTGIQSQAVSQLIVINSSITNSTSFGINAQDTAGMAITNSTFNGNGAANIQALFGTLASNSYTITGSQFTSATADNIVIGQSSVVANGSSLNLFAQNDTFTNTKSGTAGIRVNWNGTLAATVDSSNLVTSGGLNTGVSITNTSTSALSTIGYTNNTFSSTSTFDTAFSVTTSSLSQINVFDNLAQFSAPNGTGYKFALGPSSIVNLVSNTISDTAGGATGILFSSITGPSTITINDNLMNMTNSGAADTGFFFTGLSSTPSTPIQLLGTQNNGVNNAANPVVIPIGTTTGGFLVNDVVVPP
jgi:hypothetical protein